LLLTLLICASAWGNPTEPKTTAPENGWLHYNQGNSYLEAKNHGAALGYYQLAASYLPGSHAVRHNLMLARAGLAGNVSPRVQSEWRLLPESVTHFQLVLATLLANALFWVSLVAWRAKLITIKSPLYFLALVTLAGLTNLYLTLPRIQSESLLSIPDIFRPLVITISDESPLYAQPDKTSQIVKILPAGYEVRAERIAGDWSRLALPDGRFGWAHSDNALQIPAF